MVNKILVLIKKDFIIDWRQQHPFSGLLLFLGSIIITSYMAFNGVIQTQTWNVLFWIILLFTSLNGLSKSFIQEERRTIYYFFLTKPSYIILAKLIYSFFYLLSISILGLIIYSILFGNPIVDMGLFLFNMMIGILGLASAFTMISAISYRTSNRGIIMAILGFPVIIPVLILAINNSQKAIEGFLISQIQGNLITLVSIDVIIIALTFVLFPFTWRS